MIKFIDKSAVTTSSVTFKKYPFFMTLLRAYYYHLYGLYICYTLLKKNEMTMFIRNSFPDKT